MRARNIKPGFFKNEELAAKDPLARILFQGLWCMADREGRLEDRPARIKAEILPYDNCEIDSLLASLAMGDDPFITRYESEERHYIQVANFLKHQSPHLKETRSTIPAPGKHGASTRQVPDKHSTYPVPAPEEHHTSMVGAPEEHGERIPDILIPDSLIPDPLISLSKDKQSDTTPASAKVLPGKNTAATGNHCLAQIEDKKLKNEILEVVGSIDAGKFNAHLWCQAKFSEKKFNAKAILYTLTRIAKEQELKRDLWPYANKIYEVEYGKFNERDHIERSREYKQDLSRAELVSIGAVLGRMAKPP